MSDGGNNIRYFIGDIIGKKVIDITQHDKEEFLETGVSYVMIMFEDGLYVKFPVNELGFAHNCPDREDDDLVG